MKKCKFEDIDKILTHLIQTNLKNNTHLSIEVSGIAGIGKTESIIDIAKNNKLYPIVINMAQFSTEDELSGFPIKTYDIIGKDEKEHTISNDIMSLYKDSIKKIKSSYTKYMPIYSIYEGIKAVEEGKYEACCLILDDYNRTSDALINATMEIVNKGAYKGWELPKGSTVIITSNPDNGNFNVASRDEAQLTRSGQIEAIFDIDYWLKWFTLQPFNQNIKDYAIAHCIELFVLNEQTGNMMISPRMFTAWAKFNQDSSDDFAVMSADLFTDCNLGNLYRKFLLTYASNLPLLDEIFSTSKVEEFLVSLNKRDNSMLYKKMLCNRIKNAFINKINSIDLNGLSSLEKLKVIKNQVAPISDRISDIFSYYCDKNNIEKLSMVKNSKGLTEFFTSDNKKADPVIPSGLVEATTKDIKDYLNNNNMLEVTNYLNNNNIFFSYSISQDI